MRNLKLILIPEPYLKYFTYFSDIKSLFLLEVKASVISGLFKEYSQISFINDLEGNKIINLKSSKEVVNISSIPNSYYYILRSSFQYSTRLLGMIENLKGNNLTKYIYHDFVILRLLKLSHFKCHFNNLSVDKLENYSRLYVKVIVDDYFVSSNLEFLSFSISNNNLPYSERLNILYYNNYQQIIEQLQKV